MLSFSTTSTVSLRIFVELPQLCINCNQRPRWSDGYKIHEYCGKACAQAAKLGNSSISSRGIDLCTHCNAKPKRVEGNTTHEFCSRTCAKIAKEMCHKFYDQTTGKTHDYCGRTCAKNAQPQDENTNISTRHLRDGVSSSLVKGECLMQCGQPAGAGPFCSTLCASSAHNKAPGILEVPKEHEIFASVTRQFQDKWLHSPSSPPSVEKVYKVLMPRPLMQKYDDYRDAIERRGNFASQPGFTPGNERRRWHGTKRACTLGENGQTTLCSSNQCSLCSILRTSFKVNLTGTNTCWERFGTGIYTSSTSSKSDHYSQNLSASRTKVLLLNKVVVGRGFKTIENQENFKSPPEGYDSVIGEPAGTGSLQYDELVCYNDDAVRPSYLVVYTSP